MELADELGPRMCGNFLKAVGCTHMQWASQYPRVIQDKDIRYTLSCHCDVPYSYGRTSEIIEQLKCWSIHKIT